MTWRRGCIYYSALPDVADEFKTVLVVSADAVSEFLRPIVVQVTSTSRLRTFDTDVELRPPEGGVVKPSWVLCHQLATLRPRDIASDALGPPLSPRKMVAINTALSIALDLPASWPPPA